MDRQRVVRLIGIGLVGILLGVAAWSAMVGQNFAPKGNLEAQSPEIPLMSTIFKFKVVMPRAKFPGMQKLAESSIESARPVSRDMNIYNPKSELSLFNKAKPGAEIKLPPDTMRVLRYSKKVFDQSQGAFDVTAKPLIKIWKGLTPKRSVKDPISGEIISTTGGIPELKKLRAARKQSNWADLKLSENGVTKSQQSACVDLGGVAKGYAIDLIVEELKRKGAIGGLVDIGGDVRCFGAHKNGQPWVVGIQNPYATEEQKRNNDHWFARVALKNQSVCTSGNYMRRRIVDGVSYSHIVNPRTLKSADFYPSVTVIAPTAMEADAWATALSVLGPAGFNQLKGTGVEAMIIVDNNDKPVLKMTPGFAKYLAGKPRKLR